MRKIVATIIFMFASFSAHAAPLYTHELDSNIGFESLFSNIGGQVGADRFILSQDSIITEISWYGYFVNDLPPSVSSWDFQVGIYSDNFGAPSPIPNYNQLSPATVSNSGQLVNEGFHTGNTIYQFTVTLSSPLSVSAGDLNWISIAATNANWLWSESPTHSPEIGTIAFKNTNPNNPSDWIIGGNLDLAFSLNGDISEVSAAECDIQLNQATYIDGDTVTADVFRIANPTAAPLSVEWKVWLGVPGVPPISIINLGADATFVLPAGTDIDLGPLSLLPVTAALPRGNYELSCRMLDPVTGELLTEDLNVFDFQ